MRINNNGNGKRSLERERQEEIAANSKDKEKRTGGVCTSERERERERAGGKTNYVIYKRRGREQQRVARNDRDGNEYHASELSNLWSFLVFLQVGAIISTSLMYFNCYYIIVQ